MPIAPNETPAGAPGAPFKPSAGNDVTVLTDSTGAHPLISGGEDLGGAKLRSIDGTVTVQASNSGVSLSAGGSSVTVNSSGVTVGGALILSAPAAAPTSAPQLDQLSSYLTITSGTLPNTGAWVSGTAKQNPSAGQDITVNVVVVMDGTANAASCTIGISPDNTTFTTIGAPGASAAVNTVGAETFLCPVSLPATWWIKLTLVHCTVAASIYY